MPTVPPQRRGARHALPSMPVHPTPALRLRQPRRADRPGLVRTLALALCGLACGEAARGADGITTSGSLRLRHESLRGQSRPGFRRDDGYASLRTVLTGDYARGHWRAVAELQDSRTYFADTDAAISTSEVDALEVTQLYLARDFGAAFGRGSALRAQAGRFAMNVGSRRLVAADDYRNTNNSFTGLRVDASFASGATASAWYVLPVTRLPDDLPGILANSVRLDRESRSSTLRGLLLTTPRRLLGGAFELGYLEFREADTRRQATRDRELDDWTLRWYREPAPAAWDYEFEGSWQGGHARTGPGAAAPRLRVGAHLFHARLGYQLDGAWKPRLALEYDLATGDRDTNRIRRYDTLFGTRRADFAPSGLYAQLGRANIEAPGLRLELAPTTRLDAMLTWKLLRLESARDAFATTGVRDPSGASGRDAGTQLDLRLRWWAVPKRLRLEFDGVSLDKGHFLEAAPNARPGDTRFASINATFSF